MSQINFLWGQARTLILRERQHFTVAHGERSTEQIMNFGSWRNTQRLKNGCMHIRRAAAVGTWIGSISIAAAIDLATLDATAGQSNGVDIRIMIATGASINSRRTPEIGENGDQGFAKCSSVGQIL